jgi:hypothetical protein
VRVGTGAAKTPEVYRVRVWIGQMRAKPTPNAHTIHTNAMDSHGSNELLLGTPHHRDALNVERLREEINEVHLSNTPTVRSQLLQIARQRCRIA